MILKGDMSARNFIPSLASLRAFEAVAQQQSFVRAAESLNLSVGAVSHQVASLEANLNAALFVRAGQGARMTRLTPTGEELLGAIEGALDQLAVACSAIRSRRKGVKRTINVSANAPTCSLWLAPRLAKYATRNGQLEIRVKALEGEPDVRVQGLDLAVVRLRKLDKGRDQPAGRDTFLMGETVFPVCAPELLRSLPGLATDPANLTGAQLLQEENIDTPELNWEAWLPRLGINRSTNLQS